jgi:hypothetical protein
MSSWSSQIKAMRLFGVTNQIKEIAMTAPTSRLFLLPSGATRTTPIPPIGSVCWAQFRAAAPNDPASPQR